MDAKDRQQFSAVCESLAVAFRRLAEAGGYDLPFRPLDVAVRADGAAAELRQGPKSVKSEWEQRTLDSGERPLSLRRLS